MWGIFWIKSIFSSRAPTGRCACDFCRWPLAEFLRLHFKFVEETGGKKRKSQPNGQDATSAANVSANHSRPEVDICTKLGVSRSHVGVKANKWVWRLNLLSADYECVTMLLWQKRNRIFNLNKHKVTRNNQFWLMWFCRQIAHISSGHRVAHSQWNYFHKGAEKGFFIRCDKKRFLSVFQDSFCYFNLFLCVCVCFLLPLQT